MFQRVCWKPRFGPRGTQGEMKITVGDTKIQMTQKYKLDHGAHLQAATRGQVAGTCCCKMQDMLQGYIWAKFAPVTCPIKFSKFHVARVKKCQRTREDVSLRHVPETRPDNFFTSVPTPLHVPATQPCNMSRQCVLNAIFSPLHFAATYFCNMSLVWAHLNVRIHVPQHILKQFQVLVKRAASLIASF